MVGQRLGQNLVLGPAPSVGAVQVPKTGTPGQILAGPSSGGLRVARGWAGPAGHQARLGHEGGLRLEQKFGVCTGIIIKFIRFILFVYCNMA